MIYSYTQISQYLTCPRRYRHRYLDGWQEKTTHAAMLFGRAFERALAAFFLRQDAAAAMFQEWELYQDQKLEYSHGDTWDRMLKQGIQLLDGFCQDDRVRIPKPRGNLQIKFTRQLSAENELVAFIDAIGQLDDRRSLIECKTTASRYSEAPDGLLALDPQLVCYSWMTGISVVPISDSATDGQIWRKALWCGGQEQKILVGLMSLITKHPLLAPKLNRKRAWFVLTKIDEILAWEQRKEAEKDTRFVELGRYLCEVRAGQYWRLENLKSFDEFLERRFPESRRKASYLMSIHEYLPPQVRKELKQVGWTKGRELAKLARAEGHSFDCAPWVHKARTMPREEFKREV